MDQTQTSSIRWPLAVLLLAILASTVQPSNAADNEIEREHLAALIRQLDLAQKLATHAADTASPSRSRSPSAAACQRKASLSTRCAREARGSRARRTATTQPSCSISCSRT